MEVLVIKQVPDRTYIFADPEMPFSAIGNFKCKKLILLGKLPDYNSEKIAKELGLKAETFEIDQKGVPEFAAGYVVLAEPQVEKLLEYKKGTILTQMKCWSENLTKINELSRAIKEETS